MIKTRKRPFSAELQQIGLIDDEALLASERSTTQKRHDEIISEIRKLREEFSRSRPTGAFAADPSLSPDPTSSDSTASEIALSATKFAESERLKEEIFCLSKAIETTKLEIAALRYIGRDSDRITDVTFELDAVVGDTETATETILGCCESIEKIADTLELQASSADERMTVEEIGNQVIQVYEACNFQDITGQRISKVVGALKFIEERVNNMMKIWGGQEVFSEIEIATPDPVDEDQMLLNGPAREDDDTASQADIDALFD